MPVFLYEGKSLKGSKIKGSVKLNNKDDVRSMLRSRGIFPISIIESTINTNLEFNSKKEIPYNSLAIFCRQFYFALSSGIPMLRSIEIIKEQIEHKKLKSILHNVYDEVQEGSSLSEVFYKYKEIPFLLTAMIEVGESTGNINKVMNQMAEYYDKQHRQRKKINIALTYPKFLLIFTFCIILGLVSFVIPTFVEIILESGQQLPLPTKIIIEISKFINSNFLILTLIIALLFIVKKLLIDNNYTIQYKIDKFIVTNKKLSNITQQILTARFARTFAMLIKGGMSVIEALSISGNSVDNKFIRESIDDAKRYISTGTGIGETLEDKNIFPIMLTQMIKVGEETGSLDGILIKTAQYYEVESDFALQKLMSLIEPSMIVFLAIIVGFVVISILMPMFQIMSISY